MNTGNAIGFIAFGALMWLLPHVAPAWFPANGVDGSSARALWLQLIGGVEAAIGVGFVFRFEVVPAAIRWLAREPKPAAVLTRAAVPAEAAVVSPLPDVVALARSEERALLAAR